MHCWLLSKKQKLSSSPVLGGTRDLENLA